MLAQATMCRDMLLNESSHIFIRTVFNQDNRADLIRDYAERTFRTLEENRRWIEASIKEQREGLYVEFTASELKSLNDVVIQNKDLVTALVNLRKESDLRLLSEITSTIEGVETYSDYKTVRQFIPVTGEAAKVLASKLERGFADLEVAFRERLVEEGLVRSGDLDSNWFQMGLGGTAGLASIAARKAKDLDLLSSNFLIAENLVRVERDRESVVEDYLELRKDRFIDYLFGGRSVDGFSLKTVEIYRKNRDAESFSRAVMENFGYELSVYRAAKVVSFFEKVDLFSPSLVIAGRTSVTVNEVEHGAFSLDFVGLGAKNLLATVEGVLASKSVGDLIVKVRANEELVTAEFNNQKENLERIAREYFSETRGEDLVVKFSGDEGIIVPSRIIEVRDVMALQKLFLDFFGVSQLRMTYVRVGADRRLETDLVSFAEAVEKGLKKKLTSLIAPDILSQVQFNIWVNNASPSGVRTVELMLYSTVAHSENQRVAIRGAFKDLIGEMSVEHADLNLQAGSNVYGELPR